MMSEHFEKFVMKKFRQQSRNLTYNKNYVTGIFYFQKVKKKEFVSAIIDVKFPFTNSEYYEDARMKGNAEEHFVLLFSKSTMIRLRNQIEDVLKRPAVRRMR